MAPIPNPPGPIYLDPADWPEPSAPVDRRGLDRGAYPKFKVPAVYPKVAKDNEWAGCVSYRFTITEAGNVDDIAVIDSSSLVFVEAGRKALHQYRYEPMSVAGVATATPNQTIRLIWDAEGAGLPDHPACR